MFIFFLNIRESSSSGVLCGVMRIGLVAKGLLIKGDMDLELVLMCRDKPTQTLLDTVCQNLPTQIQVRDTSDPHICRDVLANCFTCTKNTETTLSAKCNPRKSCLFGFAFIAQSFVMSAFCLTFHRILIFFLHFSLNSPCLTML